MTTLRQQLEAVIGYVEAEIECFELRRHLADQDDIELWENVRDGGLWLEANLDEVLANAEFEKQD